MKYHIIIPTYNREKLILRALKSILNQNYKNYIIYIVDDGSTDNTEEILKPYLEKYSDSIIYKYKENGGVGSARNLGIELALKNINDFKNEWFLFFDSDDELTKNSFDVFNKVVDYNLSLNYMFSVVNQLGEKKCFFNKEGIVDLGYILSSLNGECFGVFNSKLFFNKENRFVEEGNGLPFSLLYKLFKNNSIFLSKQIVRIYYQDNKGITRTYLNKKNIKNNIIRNEWILRNMYNDLFISNKKKLGDTYLVLARMKALNGEKGKSIKFFIKGIKLSKDIKKILLYIISLLPFNIIINNVLLKLI